MNYRPTILNVSAAVILAGVLVFSAWNYRTLSSGEGWGIVGMFGLAGIGLFAGLIDLVLQKYIKNQWVLNGLELIIVLGLSISVFSGL